MPASFLLWCEHCPVCGHQNSIWYWDVLFGTLMPWHAELAPAKQEVCWTGLQHQRQLKESSSQSGNCQVTQSCWEMATLAFTPPRSDLSGSLVFYRGSPERGYSFQNDELLVVETKTLSLILSANLQ